MSRDPGEGTLAIRWTWQNSYFRTILQGKIVFSSVTLTDHEIDESLDSPAWKTLPPYPDPFEDELLKVQDTYSSGESVEERAGDLDDNPFDELAYVDWEQCITEVNEM